MAPSVARLNQENRTVGFKRLCGVADIHVGLARRTDEQVKRVLRSGLLPEGRVAHYRDMPWTLFSHFTEEDRHAIVVYLRHLKPVFHGIPEYNTDTSTDDTTAIETFPTIEVARHKGNEISRWQVVRKV